ncbi:hypothetical protein [Shewanella baltica]|uniref:hypothetical protein n=1 Tax=Shewanella baltica TaxID=62322 RepID=UPI00217E6A35|nr:hypothetical protein [Shewanella baltica]MCS6257447.1 hypothetical protein [Shewanella baltica]MCS6272603.1 hypothetical protein [Shewanella baltica]
MSTKPQVNPRKLEIRAQLQRHKDEVGLRLCLGCDSEPRLGYSHGIYSEASPKLPIPRKHGEHFEAFTLYCPNCGFKLDVYMGLQGALCEWHRANKPDDAYSAACWAKRFNEQMMAHDANTLEH